MLLGIRECEARSSDVVIALLEEIIKEYEHIRTPREVIVDHGSEFYGVRGDKNGTADHSCENYCQSRGIKIIYCRFNHPQTNGKLERFFFTYERHRWDFNMVQEFVYWYNWVRPHMSLNLEILETPGEALYRKLMDIIVGNYVRMVEITIWR